MKTLFRILGTAAAVAVTGAAIVALDKILNQKDPLHVEEVEFPEDAEQNAEEAAKTAEAYAEAETKASDVLEMFGSLPEECAMLRKASAHIIHLKQNINQPTKEKNISRAEREKTIVAMYNNGHSIDDIWKVSGFNSRSSVFRILNKYGVSLNRGKFSGPLGKRKNKEN